MNGIISLTIQTARICYELAFERNISIVLGDSGTGKSLLCALLSQAKEGESDIKITLDSKYNYIVMPDVTVGSETTRSWQEIVKSASNTIFFIDEFCDCLHSGSFAEVIKYTQNYYVLITRKPHSELPYSVSSIYTLESSQSGRAVRIVNSRWASSSRDIVQIDTLLTEDSGAGNLFFSLLFGIEADTAKSKTRVLKVLQKKIRQGLDNFFIIVDGAAFGSEYVRLVESLDALGTTYVIYLPECFEWLLLHSLIFKDDRTIQNALLHYLDEVDYTQHFSLENYFVDVLRQASREYGLMPYDKSSRSLDTSFTTLDNLAQINALVHEDFSTAKSSIQETSFF